MRTAIFALSSLLFISIAWADDAAAPGLLSVDKGSSTIKYRMVHKLHKFEGVSRQVEGKVRIMPGQAQVAVRAPVESFDSGNGNRDAHMKEVVEAARYGTVELKALSQDFQVPASFPVTVQKTFQGELSFHGVKKQIPVPVKLTYESADRVHATSHLVVSLDEFKIERPSLLFVKVDDAMEIDADLVFKK